MEGGEGSRTYFYMLPSQPRDNLGRTVQNDGAKGTGMGREGSWGGKHCGLTGGEGMELEATDLG